VAIAYGACTGIEIHPHRTVTHVDLGPCIRIVNSSYARSVGLLEVVKGRVCIALSFV
jgi:hypothetical protein